MSDSAYTLIEPGLGTWRRAHMDSDGFPMALDHLSDAEVDATGALFDARVTRVDATLDLAFLDLGEGREGVMNQRRARLLKKGRSFSISESVTEGERIKVQAVSDLQAMEGKAIPVTPRPRLVGRYAVVEAGGARLNFSKDLGPSATKALTPELEPLAAHAAIIIRGRAKGIDRAIVIHEVTRLVEALKAPVDAPGLVFSLSPLEQALTDIQEGADPICIEGGSALADARAMATRQFPDLVDRLTLADADGPAFEAAGVDEAVEEALSGRIDLPSGGWVSIHPTPALTAMDVNMGSAYKAKDAAEAKLEVNMEAALAIAHHLRFQNIGGLIVVDFIDMSGKGRIEALMRTVQAAVKDDPQPVTVSGLSQFGLMQINRARKGLSLLERMTVQPARRMRADAVAVDLLRRARRLGLKGGSDALVISAPETVVNALIAAPARLDALRQETSRVVTLETGDAGVRMGADHG